MIKWASAVALACWASSAQATPITFETANPFITFTSVGTNISIAISPLIIDAYYGAAIGLMTLGAADLTGTPRPSPGFSCGHGVPCDSTGFYDVLGDQSLVFSSGADQLTGTILWTVLDNTSLPRITGHLIDISLIGDPFFVADFTTRPYAIFNATEGNVSAVPIPAALPLFLSALGLFTRWRRRV